VPVGGTLPAHPGLFLHVEGISPGDRDSLAERSEFGLSVPHCERPDDSRSPVRRCLFGARLTSYRQLERYGARDEQIDRRDSASVTALGTVSRVGTGAKSRRDASATEAA
jgi:hypothetical protein